MTNNTMVDIEALRTEEHFVADAQLLLHELMLAKQITRAELAARLGVSRARISQLFSSECKNFTIRLLARAMHALGEKPELNSTWFRDRQCAADASRLAKLIADPACNVVGMRWTEEGVVVPPVDRHGNCRSDARVRAFLQSKTSSKDDVVRIRAAA